jgi:hypothetical protein
MDRMKTASTAYEDMEQTGLNDRHACVMVIAAALSAAEQRGRDAERELQQKRIETGRMISQQTHDHMLKELAKANAEEAIRGAKP